MGVHITIGFIRERAFQISGGLTMKLASIDSGRLIEMKRQ